MAAQLFFLPYRTATVNGIAQPGAKAYFYVTGTTTPSPSYTTSALTTQHAHPVVADSAGRFPDIYLSTAVTYRYILKNRLGTTLDDIDPFIPGVAADASELEPYATQAADDAAAAAQSAADAADSAVDATNNGAAQVALAATQAGLAAASATDAAASETAAEAAEAAIIAALAETPLDSANIACASRAILAAADTGAGLPAILTEAGREGVFVWSSADHSADVTRDPEEGVYVAPSPDATGASGAWVRKFSGPVNVQWFGATGDGTTDDQPAIQAALDFYAETGGGVYVPAVADRYRCADTLVIKATTHFHGEIQLQASDIATHPDADIGSTLYFDAAVPGILCKYTNDSDVSGQPIIYPGAGRSVIERLQLFSANGKASYVADCFGIESRAKVTIRDVVVRRFGDHGVCIRASLTGSDGVVYGNCNKTRLDNVVCIENAGHGFFLEGNDANACKLDSCHAQDNAKWGFYNDSLDGNTYVGCLDEGNDLGNFTALRNAQCVYIGCHTEGGLQGADLNANCAVFGGLLGATGAHVSTSSAFVMSGNLASRAGYRHVNHKATPVMGSQVGSKDANGGVFAWGQENGSSYAEWKFVYNPRGSGGYWGPRYGGSTSTVTYQIPDGTTNTGRSYAMEFPRGICIGNQAGAQAKLIITGTAAPVAGTWVQGDMVFNTAPAAAGTVGWVCTTGGSPGVWKTFGTIAA